MCIYSHVGIRLLSIQGLHHIPFCNSESLEEGKCGQYFFWGLVWWCRFVEVLCFTPHIMLRHHAYYTKILLRRGIVYRHHSKICKIDVWWFLWLLRLPSFYMNVGHFSEYSGHPNNKFQTFLKNSRVQVGVYLWCTKICIFQSRFCTFFFKIFCSVFPEKFMKNHFHFANLFTGLGFSTCTFLWNQAS